MVRVGFIVEGGTEKVLVESANFGQWLKNTGIELVKPVLDAEGGGNLLPKNIEPLITRLKGLNVDYIVILTDLEDEPNVPEVKSRIGNKYTDLIFVAVKAIEAWYLADTSAMRTWLRSSSYYETTPEQTAGKPWERLKEIAASEGKPGPGSSKIAFAKKMVKHFGFSVERSAQHPSCPSALELIDGLKALSVGTGE